MTPRSTFELKIKTIACTRPRINPMIMAVDADLIFFFSFLFALFPQLGFASKARRKKKTRIINYLKHPLVFQKYSRKAKVKLQKAKKKEAKYYRN